MALQAKPQLSFSQAIKLASSRLTDFKGRSRRSEFWWWMLLVMIAEEILTSFIPNLYVSAAVATLVMFFGLAVTARRLQDTGRSAIWVYVSYLLGIFNQFYVASSTFMQKLMDIVTSSAADPEKIAKLAEKNIGEITIMGLTGVLFSILSIIVIVFCIMDGKPETNKYGESPKYFEA